MDLSIYNRSTLDLIVTQPLDPSTGYTNTATNIGKIENSGIELDLKRRNLKKPRRLKLEYGNQLVNK